jgi:hypothetical protein
MTRGEFEEIEKQLKGSKDANLFCGLLLNFFVNALEHEYEMGLASDDKFQDLSKFERRAAFAMALELAQDDFDRIDKEFVEYLTERRQKELVEA